MENNYNIESILKASRATQSLSLLLAISLLLTAVPVVVGASEPLEDDRITIEERFQFSAPTIVFDGKFVKLNVEGASSTSFKAGAPQLPVLNYRFELPFGSRDITVKFDHSPVETMAFEGEIVQGPTYLPLLSKNNYRLLKGLTMVLSKWFLSNQQSSEMQTNPMNPLSDYTPSRVYPSEWFNFKIYVGRNTVGELTTFVVTEVYPCKVLNNEVIYIRDATMIVSYEETSSLRSLEGEPSDETTDLVILAPRGFISDLQPLVTHKEDVGLSTKLVRLDEIYAGTYFDVPNWNRDSQEKIKYFIYNAVLKWHVRYVMAVGGYRTFFGFNNPTVQFPVRYSHLNDESGGIGEPDYVTDQYYSCILKYDPVDGYVFDSWDSNGNDRFAEWDWSGFDYIDPFPDVSFGRLACRNRVEVRTMVDKIIHYETHTYGEEWFNRILSVTGDGFQDNGADTDLTVVWNVTNVPNGDYTIYGQSRVDDLFGPIDQINVTVDHSSPSKVTFLEDDHLRIEPLEDDQKRVYPGKPVAEIVVPQEGNILGKTNVYYNPPEAYCNEHTRWATVSYKNGVLQIKSKSYDPSPHDETEDLASATCIKIWIQNSDGDNVFESPWKESLQWYEGEVEAVVALGYMPDTFEKVKLWTSNGGFYTMRDCLNAFSEGFGFAYIAGHSCAMSWGDHYPGIPGGRDDGQVNGLATINLRSQGIERYAAEENDPRFPIDQLMNGDKLPVLVLSGCHSGMFDTSLMRLVTEPFDVLWGMGFGSWTPEGMAWWITRTPQGGAIATLGFTGFGYGIMGKYAAGGVSGLMCGTFFQVYGKKGIDVLGDLHTQTLIEYGTIRDTLGDQGDRKHFESFALLGDPSLKIGGYAPETGALDETDDATRSQDTIKCIPLPSKIVSHVDLDDVEVVPSALGSGDALGGYQVTKNPAIDTSPMAMISDDTGQFLLGYTHKTNSGDIHPAFALSNGGATWHEIIYSNPLNAGMVSLDTWGEGENTRYIGSVCFDTAHFGAILFPELNTTKLLDPLNWVTLRYFFLSGEINTIGEHGLAVTGYTNKDGGTEFGYFGTCNWAGGPYCLLMFSTGRYVYGIINQHARNIRGDSDEGTSWHYFVAQKMTGTDGWIVRAKPPETNHVQTVSNIANPDVAAADGWVYIVSENIASIICRRSQDNGSTWELFEVIPEGSNPKVLINDDGSVDCYYTRGGRIVKSSSNNHGETWTETGQLGTATEVDDSVYSPFVLTEEGMVFAKDDDDLYANIFISTIGAAIGDIEVNTGRIITDIKNTGTTYLDDLKWEINVYRSSPLGHFFGGKPLLIWLFSGRVLSGSCTRDTTVLSPAESKDITSDPVFGIGHVYITVTASYNGKVLAEKSEDGFLLGRHIYLYFQEE